MYDTCGGSGIASSLKIGSYRRKKATPSAMS